MSIIESSEYKSYGFTVRANSSNRADYSPFFNLIAKFKNHVTLECKYEEYGKHDWLHYHGVLAIKKRFYRKRLVIPGFHLKLEEIYNIKGWHKYITKEDTTDQKVQDVFDAMGDLIQKDKEIDNISEDELIEETDTFKKFKGSVFKKHRDKQKQLNNQDLPLQSDEQV